MAAGNLVGPVRAGPRRWLRTLVAIMILGILYWFVMDRLEQQAGEAQQQGARLVLNQVRSALVVKGAEIRLARRQDYRSWVGSNPFDWMEVTPAAYEGICGEGGPAGGKWCFRPGDGLLMYQALQPITLDGERTETGENLYWTVDVAFRDSNGNGRLDDDERQTGLRLKPVDAEFSTDQ